MEVEKATIARLKVGGEVFEVLVDCEKAIEFKQGKCSIREALVVGDIFKDAKKGERAGKLEQFFGTRDIYEIAARIIREGTVLLTAEYRRKVAEMRKREIIDRIAREAMDPRTKTPIPRSRIEDAWEKAGIKVDISKPIAEQFKSAVEELRKIIPISFEQMKVKVIVPAQHVGRAYGSISKMGRVEKEEWLSDGSWSCILSIPAGMLSELIDVANRLTSGEARVEVE